MGKIASKRTSRSSGRKRFNIHLIAVSGILLVLLFVLVAQVQLPQNIGSRAQTTITNCDVTPAESTIDSEEQKMFDLINDYRQRMGAGKLKLSPNLTRAATWLASDMNRSGRLDHTDSTARAFALRIVQCGYDGNSSAENISNLAVTAELVLEGWSASPVHNQNLLNTKFTVAGIARAGNWWALDLGSTDDSNSAPLPSVVQPSGIVTTTAPVPSATPNTPTNTIPNPNCLGSCITNTPTPTVPPPSSLTNTPSRDPNDPTNPTENPSNVLPDVSPGISPTGTPQEDGGQRDGLIGWLLEFIRLILEFFMKLLGGN